jgi:hypothetical protein
MKREDRIEGLLAKDRELMAGLKSSPDDPGLLRQRKQVRSHMNLYGYAAVKRLLEQEFAEYSDAVAEHEEERAARQARHPWLSEKIRKLAVG